MEFGKAIELFLVSGTFNGIVTVELSNWNGKGIKLPRTELLTCDRSEVHDTGVYFLFCQEDNGTDSVYIGESENVYNRLLQHIRDFKTGSEKYYWNTAVIFVGRDLNKTLIRYLEYRLVEIAKECDQYSILTKNTHKKTVIKESLKASMEEFIVNINVLLNVMGFNILESNPQPTDDTKYLYCKSSNAYATGFISPGGLTVISGSKVSDGLASSFEDGAKSYYNLRNKLELDGVIVENLFTRNYEFNAPSAASAVILGRASNGRTDWKTKDGKKLNDL